MREEITQKHILDNRSYKVSDYLRLQLPKSDTLKLVSAYFSIYGYEVLQKELNRLKDVKFLFGNPASVGELDPGKKEDKSFVLTEDGLSLKSILQQRSLARSCEKWVTQENVQIRSIKQTNFLHGKMYLAQKQNTSNAVIGSSNFTKRGLGDSNYSNVEINLATNDSSICEEMGEWFDQLWSNQDWTDDVKDDVLAALGRIGKDYSPELIYYKTLFELFYDEIERRKIDDTDLADIDLFDTQIWKKLYGFQKEGTKSVIARLKHLNGCILADSVGLGKTYTALAVIKYFELKNDRVLVLCPKRLHENWALYPSYNNQFNNPFIDDRFNFTLLSHTDLTRTSGFVGNIDLANFNWGNYDLIVIDESHNFRNQSQPYVDEEGKIRHSRYSKLLEDVIKTGPKTKVLMLSATPVNTSLNDLKHQLALPAKDRPEAFSDQLGVNDFTKVITQAEKEFKKWEKTQKNHGSRNKTKLLEKLGPDFFQLLGGVSIARSKRHIKKYYEEELDLIGTFPEVMKPKNIYPNTDLQQSLSYENLTNKINEFELSIYQPSQFLQDQEAKQRLHKEKEKFRFNQLDREKSLLGMIRTNYLKRLESSAYSLTKTLDRTVKKIDDLLDKINRFESKKSSSEILDYSTPEEDEMDEDYFVNLNIRHPYRLSQLDLKKWRIHLKKDRIVLSQALEQVSVITPERDGKLNELKSIIKHKVSNPLSDKEGNPNRKILIFTTFKDTAEYLYKELMDLPEELGINMALVSGDLTRTTVGENRFNTILTNFSPKSKGRIKDEKNNNLDLLIATDCISEGQNLQDCDTVINYDIHWNPVRILQRFGRIDRIGSLNQSVQMINFWPLEDLNKYLELINRVESRMVLVDTSASGGGNPLDQSEENPSTDSFRDQQLKELRELVIEIDEGQGNVAMSDFTLDDFFAQLLKFLENNKKKLEEMPLGVFSLTEGKGNSHKGVIFVLKQRNTVNVKEEKTASPIHPFYAVHINFQGEICISCTNIKNLLELFQQNTTGLNKPLQKLCDSFDEETKHGRVMSKYDLLLEQVAVHIRKENFKTSTSNLGSLLNPNFKLSKAGVKNPQDNFDLITWLMIK